MKPTRPNVVIVAPCDTTPAAAESHHLAKILAREGWVYFAELNREQVEDDEHGIRFLGWQETLVDHFGTLDAVVVVNNRTLAKKLSKRRADVAIIHWQCAPIKVDRRESEYDHTASQVECFNRVSPLLAVVEGCAFSPDRNAI